MSRMRPPTGLLHQSANGARETEYRMLSQISKFVAWLGVLGLASSCVAQHASAVDEKEDGLSSETPVDRGEANSNDPFGACILVDEPEHDIVPFDCARGGACWGYGEGGACEGRDGEATCERGPFYMLCENSCESSDDCPTPLTGRTTPVCHDGLCQLPCEDHLDCPDGFSCHDEPDRADFLPRSCVQILEAPPWVDP